MKPSSAIALASSMVGRSFSVFSALDIASFSLCTSCERARMATAVVNPTMLRCVVVLMGLLPK